MAQKSGEGCSSGIAYLQLIPGIKELRVPWETGGFKISFDELNAVAWGQAVIECHGLD